MTLRPMIVIGTRPEAIKLAPVVTAFAQLASCEPVVCLTGQHRDLVDPLIEYFALPVTLNLEVMRSEPGLAGLTARCLQGLDDALATHRPDCVMAQGDTTTVLAAAMAAFYRRLPFVHVEAGLRTGDPASPFPEEFNRRVAGLATALHCCPTEGAARNLLAEGVPRARVRVTGNTVIDAFHATLARERQNDAHWRRRYPMLGRRTLVLVTAHRRENLDGGLARVADAIAQLARQFPAAAFVCPVHPHPQVSNTLRSVLDGVANVHLVPPASYPEFVWLMDQASLILTDSGGIQEEASVLGKPMLVLREKTERVEGLSSGLVELVGTDQQRIVARVQAWLTRLAGRATGTFPTPFASMAAGPGGMRSAGGICRPSPYGDGQASRRIVQLVVAAAQCGWTTAGLESISLARPSTAPQGAESPGTRPQVPAPHFASGVGAVRLR